MSDTIESLIVLMDQLIQERDNNLKIIDLDYCVDNSKIKASLYEEYKERKNNILNSFENEIIEVQKKLDGLCKVVRKSQPALTALNKEAININKRFPRRISVGELGINYQNLNIIVPNMHLFPIESNMVITGEEQIYLIHKILFRLMYSIPLGKLNLYVYDPNGLGKSVNVFNKLIDNELIFPSKRIITESRHLKEELKNAIAYIESLFQRRFVGKITTWKEYNDDLNFRGENKKFLPYKVFVFFDVPDGMDSECFVMFKKLLRHSKECGILVIFSFNEIIFEAKDTKLNSISLELKKCVRQCRSLHEIEQISKSSIKTSLIKVRELGEKTPDIDCMRKLVDIYYDMLLLSDNKNFKFDDLINKKEIYLRCSKKGFDIPMGFDEVSGEIVMMEIGDVVPHYLVGGTTGSGKSTLLHNIILSACFNYSPKELQLYLLDFKDGVEFNKYINPIIPHAKLIATEADTEYGICVLKHLVEEKDRRYKLFKENNCASLTELRTIKPEYDIPRLLIVIDEFQVLFSNADKLKTIEELEKLAKQGRACGIHMILATQSLKGLDFGALGSQFGGRIALKCSPEDSKMLLGSISSNNEAAAELEFPYGIMNTSQGSIYGNQKFSMTYVKTECLKACIEELNERKIVFQNPVIFDGKGLVPFPSKDLYSQCQRKEFLLGKKIDFNSSDFIIRLGESYASNLLICGTAPKILHSLYRSVVESTRFAQGNQKLIIIGNNGQSENIEYYLTIKDFLEAYENKDLTHAVVVINEININSELKIQAYSTAVSSEFSNFSKLISIKNDVVLVCFYSRVNLIKSCIPKDLLDSLRFRIGFSLSQNDASSFIENPSVLKASPRSDRCFFAENGEIVTWFSPFMEEE